MWIHPHFFNPSLTFIQTIVLPHCLNVNLLYETLDWNIRTQLSLFFKGYVLLEAMSQLEEKFSEINIPYLLIMGEKDQICYVEGSKVKQDLKKDTFA